MKQSNEMQANSAQPICTLRLLRSCSQISRRNNRLRLHCCIFSVLACMSHKIQKCFWQGASRVPRRRALKCVTERVPRSERSQRRLWTRSILAKLSPTLCILKKYTNYWWYKRESLLPICWWDFRAKRNLGASNFRLRQSFQISVVMACTGTITRIIPC